MIYRFTIEWILVKCINTTEAVGCVLCHDITVIVKDVKMGVAFKKGHVVAPEDIPELLRLGKPYSLAALDVEILLIPLELARADSHESDPVAVSFVHIRLNFEHEG